LAVPVSLTLQLVKTDRAFLLAGKLHAILQRPYTKGRDVYDLLWYLSDPQWPPPNLTLLNKTPRPPIRRCCAGRMWSAYWHGAQEFAPDFDRTAHPWYTLCVGISPARYQRGLNLR